MGCRESRRAYSSCYFRKLLDSSPRIVRAAERSIQEHGGVVQGNHLLELYLAASSVVSRCAILRLFDQLGKWQAIIWLMRLLAAPQQKDQNEIQAAIAAWFLPPKDNQVFIKPFAHELKELKQVLERIGGELTSFIKQEILKVTSA